MEQDHFSDEASKKRPTNASRVTTVIQNTLQNGRERVAGLLHRDRYYAAAGRIEKLYTSRLKEYPGTAITIDLESKSSEGDESCTLYSEKTTSVVDLYIKLQKGDTSATIQYREGAIFIVHGNFTDAHKRMLMALEAKLEATDIRQTPEILAIHKLEKMKDAIVQRVLENTEKATVKETEYGTTLYFVHESFSGTRPLFGFSGYINGVTIDTVIQQLRTNLPLHLSFRAEQDNNHRYMLTMVTKADGEVELNVTIAPPGLGFQESSYVAIFSPDGRFSDGAVSPDKKHKFNKKKLRSYDGSFVIGELRRVFSAFEDDPFDPNDSIFPDKGYMKLDEAGKIIQITPAVFAQIEEEIKEADETVRYPGNPERYRQRLQDLKAVLVEKIKQHTMRLVDDDGELLLAAEEALGESGKEFSLDDLLQKPKNRS